jgi:putative endopeptidase
MISSQGFFSFALLVALLGCSAPATNSENARRPSSAPPGYVQPVFHSNKKPTRDELYQNARVPAHRDFPLSEKIKPCDDFYEYVCSEVKNNFTLPDDRSRHSFTFSDPNERLLAAKKNYLAFLVDKPHLTARQKILKTNYVACLNEPARATEEKQSVANEVAQITALSDLKQLRELMSQRMLLPEFSMASLDFANSDLLNNEKYNVYVVSGSMTLPERSYYHDQKVRDAIKNIYSLFFKTIGRDNADARAEKLLDFETRIADTKPLPAELRPRRSSTNYIVKREDLLSKYPAVMFEPALKEVPKDTQLVDLTPEVTRLVNEFLSNGDLETLKDYILYRGLAGRMDEGYPEFFAARFQFENQFLGGPVQRPELHERCAQFMDRAFNFELSAELLPLLFASDTQSKVQAIADKIRATKLTEIKETKWISEQGREGALAKMKKLRLMIFKPKTNKDWLFNGPGAVYKETTFIQNAKNTANANLWRDIRKTKLKRNHDEWHMSPTTVNAYYSPSDNQFVLPASVFQPPFYVEGAPQYLNVASIGSVTGHEIGHSIDDQGANFDANGEVRQWLSDADLKEFHKQADDKLVKLFDTITVNGMPHNGKLTLGENIGDNVGLRTAYRVAFENTDKVNPEELKKMKQLFFAQYARVWCYVARPKAVEAQMKTDPHALGEGRANGQVVQMDGFYDAYSCKPGDKMYVAPENRVKIW